jgi:hypothetical protein
MDPSRLPAETALDRPDRVDAIMEFLTPAIEDLLERLEGDEFTTVDFIEIMRSDEAGEAAYLEAVRRWGESEQYAKMVLHGQAIPGVLRRSKRVEWLGFAHGVPDAYAVPANWRLRNDVLGESEDQPQS